MSSDNSESERPPTMLCVDDDADGLRLSTLILENSGYTVLSSTHPARDLDMIEALPVDAAVVVEVPSIGFSWKSDPLEKSQADIAIIGEEVNGRYYKPNP